MKPEKLTSQSGARVRRTGTRNSRYREFFIFFEVLEQIATGKKVSEPVLRKCGTGKSFGTSIGKSDTGTDFCRQNVAYLNIYNGHRYRNVLRYH